MEATPYALCPHTTASFRMPSLLLLYLLFYEYHWSTTTPE